MGLFSDLIGGAINSAINYNDKEHFFKILCLVIYADSGSASESDMEVATDLYNTIFNEDMIAVQIYKKLKSIYQDMYNSNKSPEEIIEDIESGRIDRNKLKMFFICACYMSFANVDNVEKISKKKLYMVYLIKDGFYLDDDEVNDAYIFAKNNFGINGIAYQNMVTAFEAAFEYFENNEFEEDEEDNDDTYLSYGDKNISISTQKDESIQDNEDMEISEEDIELLSINTELSGLYLQNKQYKKAIDSLWEAIGINPNDSNTWELLGWAYYYDCQYKEAKTSLLQAIEINPNNSNTWGALGGACYYDGQYDEAKYFLLKALELDPGNWHPLAILGNLYYKNGQYKEAIDNSLKSIELRANIPSWITLCRIYRKNGNIKELENAVAKAKELEPNLDYDKLIMDENIDFNLGPAYLQNDSIKKR